MKLAKTSFIHTSLNQRIVTRSPNHMCAVSCAITLARSEQLVLRRATRRASARRRCRRSRRRAPCRRTGTTGSARNRTCRTGTGWRCSRSSQASAAACRSKIASRLRATFAASVSRWNMRNVAAVALGGLDLKSPAANANRYVGSGSRLGKANARAAVAVSTRSRLGAVRQRFPSGRHVERQRPARLQIRLIEAGKRHVARAPARRACRGSRRCG